MSSRFVPVTLALGLLAVPAFGSTICTTETMAGRWIGGDQYASCRLDFRDNGRLRGICTEHDEYWDGNQWIYDVEQISIRGRFNIESDCSIRVRLNAEFEDGEVDTLVVNGRVTGSAGTDPDLAFLATNPRADGVLNINLYRD